MSGGSSRPRLFPGGSHAPLSLTGLQDAGSSRGLVVAQATRTQGQGRSPVHGEASSRRPSIIACSTLLFLSMGNGDGQMESPRPKQRCHANSARIRTKQTKLSKCRRPASESVPGFFKSHARSQQSLPRTRAHAAITRNPSEGGSDKEEWRVRNSPSAVPRRTFQVAVVLSPFTSVSKI